MKERFAEVKRWNVELFGGLPEDNNAFFFYNGAMLVLHPLIASGDIVIPSGQMGMDVVGTLRWDGAVAQARIDNLLSSNYGDKALHIALSPYDGLFIGILSSVKGVGYSSGYLAMPIVMGQDCELRSIKSIIAGEQYSSIFKDTRELVKVTVGMADAVLSGRLPEINDTTTYDNGVKVVSSYLLESQTILAKNYDAVLVGSGYRRLDQLKYAAFKSTPAWAGTELLGDHMTALLKMRRISKVFPGVRALDNVSLSVQPGEIHAICGENGAGKWTLMKVPSGVYPDGSYEGDTLYDGKPLVRRNIRDSEDRGIIIIHQELALVPLLSIAENLFLGNEVAKRGVINWAEVFQKTETLLRKVGLSEAPTTKVEKLGVGKQQLIEIAKALAKDVRLLILDEPTAALQENDSQKLLDLMLGLKAQGVTQIIISHKLNEIGRVADRIAIIRDGASVSTLSRAGISEDRIIRDMFGCNVAHRYPERMPQIGETLLEVKGRNVRHPDQKDRHMIRDVNFQVRKEENVGIAALMGAGRTELAMSLFGRSYRRNVTGEVRMAGKLADTSTAAKAIDAGLAYVTENRKVLGWKSRSCTISSWQTCRRWLRSPSSASAANSRSPSNTAAR
jgi:ABC-type sugar transport system ATPase subunit